MSSRLIQEVREKRGLVYSVYAFHSAFVDGGLFGVYAGTGSSEVRELVPVVCDELAKLTQSVSEEELAGAGPKPRPRRLRGRGNRSSGPDQFPKHFLFYGRGVPGEYGKDQDRTSGPH